MSMDLVKVMRSLTKSWNGNQGGIEPADDVFCPGGNVQKTGIFPLDSRSGEPASPIPKSQFFGNGGKNLIPRVHPHPATRSSETPLCHNDH
jgi:hypothetical protein